MPTGPTNIDWHRSFGLAVEGNFSDYPFEIQREQDMSVQEQFLDLLILNTKPGKYPAPLPDGLDNLNTYNLVSYKSLRESLNVWTIEELINHYAAYRKILSGGDDNKLPPRDKFQLYAICTRYPREFMKNNPNKRVKKGVYDIIWGERTVRVIVLSRVAKAKRNALWNLFSNVKENIEYGLNQYHTSLSGSKLETMSSVIDKVFEFYGLEGLHMAYTMEQFQKDHFMHKLPSFMNDTKMQEGIVQTVLKSLSIDNLLSQFSADDIFARLMAKGRLSVDSILSYLSPAQRLKGLSPDERLAGLSLDERLEGLSPDEIQDYLQTIENH